MLQRVHPKAKAGYDHYTPLRGLPKFPRGMLSQPYFEEMKEHWNILRREQAEGNISIRSESGLRFLRNLRITNFKHEINRTPGFKEFLEKLKKDGFTYVKHAGITQGIIGLTTDQATIGSPNNVKISDILNSRKKRKS